MTTQDALDMITEIYDSEKNLSTWEIDFLDDLSDWLRANRPTPRQADKLRDIHAREDKC